MAVNKRLLQGAAGAAGGLVPSENFKAVTYTGNGGTQSITGVGFKPDFVWIKERSAAESHRLFDSTRGATKRLFSDNTNAESTATDSLTSFDTDGFSLGSSAGINESGQTYVAWAWKANGGTTSSNTDGTITSTVQANTDAGFSIVKYTGNNVAGATIGHGLASAPDVIIVKNYDTTDNWTIQHSDLGYTYYIDLNNTNAATVNSGVWYAAPTSNVFSFGANPRGNGNGNDIIAYCFHSVEGFSKFGTYTGNGDANGPIVETGFEPAFLMLKRTDGSAGNWFTFDNKRSPSNERNDFLHPNSNAAETVNNSSYTVDFLSNGFQIKGNGDQINGNNGTHIYMAFAADPDTEAPTLADSFSTVAYSGDSSSTRSIDGLGFKPGLVWIKNRTINGSWHHLNDIVRGANNTIFSNATNASTSNIAGGYLSAFEDDGFELNFGTNGSDVNKTGENYVAWAWKADDNEPTILPNTELSSLISKYKFEDNANDDYGDNSGTASNLSYVSGRFGKAADFNGSSSKILYPQAAPFNDSNTILAISAWVKLDSASDEFVIMSASSTSDGNDHMALILGGSRAGRFFIRDASGSDELQANFGSTNNTNWNHYVWQLSATNGIELWVNGVSQTRTVTVQTGGMTTSSWFSDIAYATGVQYATGINRVVSTAYYAGEVDQMRLFDAELTSSEISSLYNEANEALVSANANAGFSIVKWTGTGAINKVPHGLSAAPEMILIKDLDSASDWQVYHTSIGNGNKLVLNSTAAASSTTRWDSTSPTATAFTLRDIGLEGGLIAYCFHSVSGYSAFGSYAGNGTSQSINIGFKPDLLILRKYDDDQDWMIWDSVRDGNPKTLRLEANNSDAEVSGTTNINFISTGFEFTSGYYNDSGQNSIYMAFKMNPTPYPLAGNMSFLVIAGGGSGGARDAGPGGAGGLRTSYGSTSGGGLSAESDITLAAGTYTITIGAGGAKVVEVTAITPGNQGVDSSLSGTGMTTVTSLGGGKGGDGAGTSPGTGGSGGGGTASQSGGSGTSGQGFAGASGTGGYTSGGGGGAGATGNTPPSNENGGAGGSGLSVSITGSSTAYAGGGGGSGDTSSGAGGTGGGGAGQSNASLDATSGTANTGGGGGSHRQNLGTSGAGGSGVVVLRLLTSEYSSSTTGSPTVTTDGDYTILTYTGSGTYVHS